MSQPGNMVQESNWKRYFSKKVLRGYTTYNLMRTEALVLLKHQPRFAQKDVLDIGIGTGRTTVYLAPLASEYVGIDFSPTFISHVEKNMPGVCAKLCDMRDLGEFSTHQFDFIMGSFNVFDLVTHPDRIRTLAEVHRVLKPGGMLIFSSHNRAYKSAGSRPKLTMRPDPLRQAREVIRWVQRLRNYSQWKKFWVFTQDHAIITDEGNDFSTLHYYVDQNAQRRQLAETGFSVLEVYGTDGNLLQTHEVDAQSPFLTYVVEKPAV